MIVLKHPITGETKEINEGEPYQRCIAGVCWEVVGSIEDGALFEAKTGIKIGDNLAKLTKAFGIKPCSKCEQRRLVLNEMQKLGIKGTLKALAKIGLH